MSKSDTRKVEMKKHVYFCKPDSLKKWTRINKATKIFRVCMDTSSETHGWFRLLLRRNQPWVSDDGMDMDMGILLSYGNIHIDGKKMKILTSERASPTVTWDIHF